MEGRSYRNLRPEERGVLDTRGPHEAPQGEKDNLLALGRQRRLDTILPFALQRTPYRRPSLRHDAWRVERQLSSFRRNYSESLPLHLTAAVHMEIRFRVRCSSRRVRGVLDRFRVRLVFEHNKTVCVEGRLHVNAPLKHKRVIRVLTTQ